MLCPACAGTLRNQLPSARESRAMAASGSPVIHYPRGREQMLPSLADTAPGYGSMEKSRRARVYPALIRNIELSSNSITLLTGSPHKGQGDGLLVALLPRLSSTVDRGREIMVAPAFLPENCSQAPPSVLL